MRVDCLWIWRRTEREQQKFLSLLEHSSFLLLKSSCHSCLLLRTTSKSFVRLFLKNKNCRRVLKIATSSWKVEVFCALVQISPISESFRKTFPVGFVQSGLLNIPHNQTILLSPMITQDIRLTTLGERRKSIFPITILIVGWFLTDKSFIESGEKGVSNLFDKEVVRGVDCGACGLSLASLSCARVR